MDLLLDLLELFEPQDTHLFNTTRLHIFYDGATCLAFEKASISLGPFPPVFTNAPRSVIRVERGPLRDLLSLLEATSHLDPHKNVFVTFRVEGSGQGSLLFLQTRDEDGKSLGVGALDCLRLRGEGMSAHLPQYTGHISLPSLVKVLSHFDSSYADIEELHEGVLRVQDDRPGFKATSWIARKVAPPPEKKPLPRGGYGRRR